MTTTTNNAPIELFDLNGSPNEERQLAEWAANGALIELVIYYPGGSVRIFGRVQHIESDMGTRPFLTVGDATFPIDALVRKECVGSGWIFNAKNGGR